MFATPEKGVSAVVLGSLQDGGLPHIGCRCRNCLAAGQGDQPLYVASLAIVDHRGARARVWLIDATPDIKYQIALLAEWLGPHPKRPGRLRQVDGIFLSHAHMGHIGGLPQLGPEAMAAQQLTVYAAHGLVSLLSESRLWRPVVDNLRLKAFAPKERLTLAPDLHITPIPVPHRDEWEVGTYAFRIQGPSSALLYLPDIDAWEEWPKARQQLGAVQYALVDASFYHPDELGGRPPVAHPLVPHTLDLFSDLPCQLVLTHLNHTNPLLAAESAEKAAVLESGVLIAQTGQRFPL